LLDWEWYTNPNAMRVFIHFLIVANYEDKEWKGVIIKRGQLVCRIRKLAQELGITEQNVKTALKNLQSTNDITIATSAKYTLVEVTNYDLYQENKKSGTQSGTQSGTCEAAEILTLRPEPTHKVAHKVATTKEEKEKKNPPLPPQREEGDFFISEKANDLVWNLTSENREEARQHAKGLCLHKLADIFLNRKEKPDFRNIEAAFIGWIKCYTKKMAS